MQVSLSAMATILALVLCSCVAKDATLQSVYTDLGAASCKKEVDRTDPNETPYLVCPGAAGYSLIMRRVDAGRYSIDIRDTAQREFPLRYEEYVTRSMSTLDGKAEWKVGTKDGQQAPVALIVRVQAHEDNANPENVTQTYLAIAKISAAGACVTDAIPVGAKPEADVRKIADSSQTRPCAPPQPPMKSDGAIIR